MGDNCKKVCLAFIQWQSDGSFVTTHSPSLAPKVAGKCTTRTRPLVPKQKAPAAEIARERPAVRHNTLLRIASWV
eukprot:281189-Amphidinium_carterae.1